jgi:hypothetical protein
MIDYRSKVWRIKFRFPVADYIENRTRKIRD